MKLSWDHLTTYVNGLRHSCIWIKEKADNLVQGCSGERKDIHKEGVNEHSGGDAMAYTFPPRFRNRSCASVGRVVRSQLEDTVFMKDCGTLRTSSAILKPEGPSSLQTCGEGRSPILSLKKSSTLQGCGAEPRSSGACLPTRLTGEQCFHGKRTAKAKTSFPQVTS